MSNPTINALKVRVDAKRKAWIRDFNQFGDRSREARVAKSALEQAKRLLSKARRDER